MNYQNIFSVAFLLIAEAKSIHFLVHSWLQAAQDFREKQDKENKENLRKSYRIRLGRNVLEHYEIFLVACFCTLLQ